MTATPELSTPVTETPPKTKKKRSKFMIAFLLIQGLFLLWVVGGLMSASGTPDDCGTLSAELCNGAETVGTAIGLVLVVMLWVAVDFIVGVTYAIYRLAKR